MYRHNRCMHTHMHTQAHPHSHKHMQMHLHSEDNGAMEHTFALNSLLEDTRTNNLLIFVTFLDLENAFESIPHALIMDMLKYIRLTTEVTSYVADLYSKFQAIVSTKEWNTNCFTIQRGIFQGDTLSPLPFLVAFQPVLYLANSLEAEGYQLHLSIHP